MCYGDNDDELLLLLLLLLVYSPIAIQFGVDLSIFITVQIDQVNVFSDGCVRQVEMDQDMLCLIQNGDSDINYWD